MKMLDAFLAIGGLLYFVIHAAPDGRIGKFIFTGDYWMEVKPRDWRRRKVVMLPLFGLTFISWFLQSMIGARGLPTVLFIFAFLAYWLLIWKFEIKSGSK